VSPIFGGLNSGPVLMTRWSTYTQS